MTLPRRMLLLLVAAVVALMLTAGPALAAPAQAQAGLAKAYINSGGKSPIPVCTISCE